MNGGEGFIVLMGLAIAVSLIFRLLAGSMDGDRVRQYINGIGGELLEKQWDPFGPGWLGEKNERIYKVRYRDREGCIHAAHVKTSMLSGVYLTNDEIVGGPDSNRQSLQSRHPDPTVKLETLEEERERLRKQQAERKERE